MGSQHTSALAQHIEHESARWAAQELTFHPRRHPDSPASSDGSDSSSLSSGDVGSAGPLFSPAPSRRSSISSNAPPFDILPLHHHDVADHAAGAHHGASGLPHEEIPVYASLDEAVERSMAALEALPVRRLTTPGKLYENEEDDDEITEREDAATVTG